MKQEQPPQSAQSFTINLQALERCGLKATATQNTFTAPFMLGTAAIINYLRAFQEQPQLRLSCSILIYNDYKAIEKNYSLIRIETITSKVNNILKKQLLVKVMKNVKEANKGYTDTIVILSDKIIIYLGSINCYRITLTPTPIELKQEEPEVNLWQD